MIQILSGNIYSFFQRILIEHLSYVRYYSRCWKIAVIEAEEIPVHVEYVV